MARFNVPFKRKNTTNLAGGTAYQQSSEQALAAFLLTSFVSNQTYRGSDAALEELRTLLTQVDPLFAAKAGVLARTEYGMRSVSHVVAAELAHNVRGAEWSRRFFERIVRRPDDITEIVAYYLQQYGKPLPNALKAGLAASFGKFDAYQLAKYRASIHELSLVDVVNLVHPKPTEKNGDALKALVANTLRSEDTWETRISAAGQDTAARRLVWKELLETDRLGYFALLRNLRNIITDAPDMLDLACEQLTDPQRIRGSLVLPFRFTTAYQEISQIPGMRGVTAALSRAIDISAANCPAFDGSTLIAVDTSGSMHGRPSEIATLFAAMLYKRNPQADLLLFDTAAHPLTPNPEDSILSIARSMPFHGGGTDFNIVFDYARKPYDSIIILSDMQAWAQNGLYGWSYGKGDPKQALSAYRKRTGNEPKIYSFDLAGYGSTMFPEQNVFSLAGFSDKALDVMQLLDQGKTLADVVNEVEL